MISPEHVAQSASESWGKGRNGVSFGASPPAIRMFHPFMDSFFDSRLPAELHPSSFVVEKTLGFIRANRARPFFAHCSFVDPHPPLNAPMPFNRMYDPREMPVPACFDMEACYPQGLPAGVERRIQKMKDFPPELWQWAHASYLGMVSHIDWCVGRLLDGLRDLGLSDDTLIVYTSDHGDYAGDHRLLYKGSLMFDSLLKVPLTITWPSGVRGGRRVSAMVQGMDLGALISGSSETGYERVYCELDDLPGSTWAASQAVRTREWKLEYFPKARRGLLYNLRDDPGELRNLFDDPRCKEIRHSLMMDLLDHLHASKDPLPIRLSGA